MTVGREGMRLVFGGAQSMRCICVQVRASFCQPLIVSAFRSGVLNSIRFEWISHPGCRMLLLILTFLFVTLRVVPIPLMTVMLVR